METTTNTKREAILAKIRALRNKTVENGCTEAEAMAAAEKLAAWMHEYNVVESDLQTASSIRVGAMRRQYANNPNQRIWPATHTCWSAIAKLCGVECWLSGTDLCFFGEEEDVRTAFYLVDLLISTSESECAAFLRANRADGASGATKRASFMHGFSASVNRTLWSLIREKNQREQAVAAENNECTAIQVQRGLRIQDKWKTYQLEKGLRIRASRGSSTTTRDSNAYERGKASGSSVRFGGGSKGVSGGSKRLS